MRVQSEADIGMALTESAPPSLTEPPMDPALASLVSISS